MSINAHTYGDRYSGAGGDLGSDSARHAEPPTDPDRSPAAARLLEMTARETDQWRSEAKGEAAAILAGAREEAAKLLRAAREEAERLVTAARDKAEQTVNDARVEAYRVREERTGLRTRGEEDLARLQQVATDHRESGCGTTSPRCSTRSTQPATATSSRKPDLRWI